MSLTYWRVRMSGTVLNLTRRAFNGTFYRRPIPLMTDFKIEFKSDLNLIHTTYINPLISILKLFISFHCPKLSQHSKLFLVTYRSSTAKPSNLIRQSSKPHKAIFKPSSLFLCIFNLKPRNSAKWQPQNHLQTRNHRSWIHQPFHRQP